MGGGAKHHWYSTFHISPALLLGGDFLLSFSVPQVRRPSGHLSGQKCFLRPGCLFLLYKPHCAHNLNDSQLHLMAFGVSGVRDERLGSKEMYRINNSTAPDIVAEFIGGGKNTSCAWKLSDTLVISSDFTYLLKGWWGWFVCGFEHTSVYVPDRKKEKEGRLDGWEKKASSVLLLMRQL